MPKAITYSDARQNLTARDVQLGLIAYTQLAATMARVCDAHEPVIIARQKSMSVVMMSLEDYSGIMETAYLLCSPANAQRLREALGAMDQVEQHNLVD